MSNESREVQIGPWISSTFNHFSANWQKYLTPALMLFGANFVLLFILAILAGGAFFVGSMIDQDVLGPLMGGLGALFGGVMFALVIPALSVGFLRGILAVNRGEAFEPSMLTQPLKEIPSIAGLAIAIIAAVGVGYVFCVIPGLVAAIGLSFALPIYAERRLGIVECMQESWEMAKPNLLMLFVYFFVCGLIVGVINYIPFVGWVIGAPLMSMFILSAYLGLTGQGELKA